MTHSPFLLKACGMPIKDVIHVHLRNFYADTLSFIKFFTVR